MTWRILIPIALVALAACQSSTAAGDHRPSPSTIAQPSPSPKGLPASSPSPLALSGSGLESIRMVDDRTGWGVVSGDHGGVVRTSDSAENWSMVSPPGLGRVFATEFFDAMHAWVVHTEPAADNSRAVIRRTADGGQTWRTTEVPAAPPSYIAFIDLQRGWTLAITGAAAGSETVDIERTVDGGATWGRVYATAHDSQGLPTDDPQGIGFGCDKGPIAFRDAIVGWVTLSNCGGLVRTQDGGRTWRAQTLPPGGSGTDHVLQAPLIFGDGHGVLPYSVPIINADHTSTHARVGVETSADGGLTWSLNQGVVTTGGQPFFVASKYGFLAAGESNRLYRTIDGGRNWAAITVQALTDGQPENWTPPTELDFITSAAGWSLSSHAVDSTGRSAELFRTDDAGATWRQVHYKINPAP